MKRIIALLASLILMLALVSCGGSGSTGGKYGDVVAVMEKYIGAIDKYSKAMEGAESADAVVAAIKDFGSVMKELAPSMMELEKKYPEMKNQAEPPAELKATMEKLEGIMGNMMKASMKALQYANDEKVKAATEELQQAMGAMK